MAGYALHPVTSEPNHTVFVRVEVDGDPVEAAVPAHRTLLDWLREDLGRTAPKQGCDLGECGTCTVLLDGDPVLACTMLAAEADGRRVTTAQGLGALPEGRALQEAFVRHGAAQCGFCTPGMLASATALLQSVDAPPDRDAVRRALAGNLCRCTGYVKILDAVVDAAERLAASDASPSEEAP